MRASWRYYYYLFILNSSSQTMKCFINDLLKVPQILKKKKESTVLREIKTSMQTHILTHRQNICHNEKS